MNLFPLQMGFIERLAHLILVAETDDGQHIQLIGDLEQETYIIVGIPFILRHPITDLTPAAAQSQILRYRLYVFKESGQRLG